VKNLGGYQIEILRYAQNDKNSLLSDDLYENISVGRASVQWGGRPRPPTDMAARDGRPTNTSHFSFFVVFARK
jgi:hypothetical protein